MSLVLVLYLLSTKWQVFLSFAVSCISLHVLYILLIFAFNSLLHVLLDLPLSLCISEQGHFSCAVKQFSQCASPLCSLTSTFGGTSVLSKSSALMILSYHFCPIIYRQQLMNMCGLLVIEIMVHTEQSKLQQTNCVMIQHD